MVIDMAATNNNKDRSLTDFKSAKAAINKFKETDVKSAMTKLLQEVDTFNNKYKIQVGYLATEKYLEVGNVSMPKTLLNFLLSKYVEANRLASKQKKPTPVMLLAMLYKHQKFNVIYKKRLALLTEPVKQPAKEDASAAVASMTSTPDNTTMAPPVSMAAGDIPQGPMYNVFGKSGQLLCTVYGDNMLATKLEMLGKRWTIVKHGNTIVRTNSTDNNVRPLQ